MSRLSTKEIEKLVRAGKCKCRLCMKVKSINQFPRNKREKHGIVYTCLQCIREDRDGKKEELNRAKRKERAANPEKFRKKQREYCEKNREKIREKDREWYSRNKEIKKDKVKKYLRENRHIENDRRNKRYQEDMGYRATCNVRERMKKLFRENNIEKQEKFVSLIGCSTTELKSHLENQFKDGMTWDNYGQFGWHIDHKIPCKSFDLTKESDRRICFHYSNLQPLWWKDNLEKGSR